MWTSLFGGVCLALLVVTSSGASVRTKRQAVEEPDITCEKADIVFVLDSSGSVGANNWELVKRFTQAVVRELYVGVDAVQVGLMIYGNKGYVQWNLNTYVTQDELVNAIDFIPWKDEATNTSGAMWTARTQLFTAEAGDRDSVPNLMIVVTDGESNRDKENVVPEGLAAKEAGIEVLVLGITDQIDQDELLNIVAGNSDNIFMAAEFTMLDSIKSKVTDKACSKTTVCTALGDLVFILDSSGSVRSSNFDKVLNMVSSLVKDLPMSAVGERAGVITFSTNARIEIQLTDYTNASLMAEAVKKIKYVSGTTNTAEALNLMVNNMLLDARPDMPTIAVIFTDGGSNDFEETVQAANNAKQAGVIIIVVALGDWINTNEIRSMATMPVESNVFSVSFADLDSISGRLQEAFCNDIDDCVNNPCQNGGSCQDMVNMYMCDCPQGFMGMTCQYTCQDPADVVLALDSSSSIGDDNYFGLLAAMKHVVGNMNINPDYGMQVAVETFSDTGNIRSYLNQYENPMMAMDMMNYEYSKGTTNTANAIKDMSNSIFGTSGDRSNVRNIGIIVTDGHSNSRNSTFYEASKAHENGITMLSIAVNVQGAYNAREVRGITSDPDESNMLSFTSYQDVYERREELVARLSEAMCNNINECSSNPCQGDAICVDGINKFTCQCPFGRTGLLCERSCDGTADIILMIDSSGSIREDRFEDVKSWAKQVVYNLEVTESRTRIGVLQFSDNAQRIFDLNQFRMKEDVIQAIDSLEYTRGKTNIADALAVIRDMFTANYGDRVEVPNFAILLSDGQPTVDVDNTLPEAIQARIDGIHLIVVVPEGDANSLSYQGIASRPFDYNIFAVPNFALLSQVQDAVINSVCDDFNECSSNPCQNGGICLDGLSSYLCLCQAEYTGENCDRRCMQRWDVVFILDASGSNEENFALSQALSTRIVQGLNFAGSLVRVGMMLYTDDSYVQFQLNTYSSQLEVLNAIAFLRMSGKTNTAGAINKAKNEMFTSSNGDRSGDPNVIILLTDGFSNVNEGDTLSEAQNAKDSGISIIAVGMGTDIRQSEIDDIASTPTSEYSYNAQRDSLDSVANLILDRLCS